MNATVRTLAYWIGWDEAAGVLYLDVDEDRKPRVLPALNVGSYWTKPDAPERESDPGVQCDVPLENGLFASVLADSESVVMKLVARPSDDEHETVWLVDGGLVLAPDCLGHCCAGCWHDFGPPAQIVYPSSGDELFSVLRRWGQLSWLAGPPVLAECRCEEETP